MKVQIQFSFIIFMLLFSININTAEASGLMEDSVNIPERAQTISKSSAPSSPISLTPHEAEEFILNGSVIVVDIRSADFFKKDHLKNAISLPYNEIQELAASFFPDKTTAILVYCQTGEQSPDAVNTFANLDYKNVYFLEGGLDSWHGPIVGEWENIEFNSSIVRRPDIQKPFSFVTEQSIHENLGSFTFILDGYYISEYMENYRKKRWVLFMIYSSIHTISIKNPDGTMLQVIDNLETMNEHGREDNKFVLTFEDWNFDGYLDMSLMKYVGGTSGNRPAYYWLWEPGIEQFVQNDDLMRMNAPEVDTENRKIFDAGKSGMEYFQFSSYEYTNGRFIEVHRTVRDIIRYPEDSNDVFERITETNFITGEVTITLTPYN